MSEGRRIGRTRSLCPICLTSLPAQLVREADQVFIRRVCPEHGSFSGMVWQGEPALESWHRPKKPSLSVLRQTGHRRGCPHDCGRCPEHGQHACTVLFEITDQCNLRCPVCFADAGTEVSSLTARFPSLQTLTGQLRWIREQAGEIVLQLSGGEPTLHPELPELVQEARALFPAVQLNTNGLLLAERPGLAPALAGAGLSWVFLQFDGTDDAIFTTLRGRPLLRQKLAAIGACKRAGLAVVLVPTVAAGVNDRDLGNLLRLAISLAPTVRGLHVQPMTGSGRNALADRVSPLTLPEVLQALCAQSGGLMLPEHATPPGCEHERCSFHCRYRLTPSGTLLPLRGEAPCCVKPDTGPDSRAESGLGAGVEAECDGGADATLAGARRAVDTIMRVWQPPQEERASGPGDAFDAYIRQARDRTFSVTCMAFQDARTVDLERLKGCCVHVYAPPSRLVPFCAYNLTALDGTPLHRRKPAEPASPYPAGSDQA